VTVLETIAATTVAPLPIGCGNDAEHDEDGNRATQQNAEVLTLDREGLVDDVANGDSLRGRRIGLRCLHRHLDHAQSALCVRASAIREGSRESPARWPAIPELGPCPNLPRGPAPAAGIEAHETC